MVALTGLAVVRHARHSPDGEESFHPVNILRLGSQGNLRWDYDFALLPLAA
jgi:hypothetical protein